MGAARTQTRKKYFFRLLVWTKPSTRQNRNRGAARRPTMLHQVGIQPV